MKKIFILSWIIMTLFSSFMTSFAQQGLHSKYVRIQEELAIKSYYKIEVQQDLAMEYNIIYVENKEEKLILTTHLINDARSQPVIELNKDEVLLAYHSIYNHRLNTLDKLPILVDIFYADVNASKELLAYVGKNNQGKFEIGFYEFSTGEYNTILIIEPSDWGDVLNAEMYVDWGQENILYFDAPNKGKPCIMMYNTQKQTMAKVKENARIPIASNNGEWLAYISTDAYSGYGSIPRKTMIEQIKTNEIAYQTEGEKIVLIDDDNSIGLLGEGIFEILDNQTMKIEKTIPIHKNVICPSFENCKLCYVKTKLKNYHIIESNTYSTE